MFEEDSCTFIILRTLITSTCVYVSLRSHTKFYNVLCQNRIYLIKIYSTYTNINKGLFHIRTIRTQQSSLVVAPIYYNYFENDEIFNKNFYFVNIYA